MKREIEKCGPNVHVVKIDFDSSKNEQWFLLRSDAHHDSADCDRVMEKKHLDQALERNALIIDYGDVFDAMQGRHDKRQSKMNLRPEYKVDDYFNAIVNDAADFYAPYAKNWVVFGYGNHETSVTKNTGNDILQGLTTLLNYKTGAKTSVGGYTGYVRFQISQKGSRIGNKVLKYDHGSGGGGVVTAGVIQAQRRAVFVSNADYVCTGHVHDAWMRVFMKESLSPSNRIDITTQYHLCSPGYKEEYKGGVGGWHVERGAPPKPNGAIWLRLYIESGEIKEEISFAA